jgi:multidrug resistance efflux pump
VNDERAVAQEEHAMAEIPIERKPRGKAGVLVLILILVLVAAAAWYWWSRKTSSTTQTGVSSQATRAMVASIVPDSQTPERA